MRQPAVTSLRLLVVWAFVALVTANTNRAPPPSSVASRSTIPRVFPREPTPPQIETTASKTARPSLISSAPRRPLTPPFPNGLCGGTIVDIPPDETFGLDVNLARINLLGDLVLLPRPIRVWLPPGYDDGETNDDDASSSSGRRHPVLYVHDGQNAMEDTDSWTGASWRLAGALTRLADHGMLFGGDNLDQKKEEEDDTRPSSSTLLPIVVLMPSAEGDLLPGIRRRHLEYGDLNFPFAQTHADLVANTVKPLVDNRFRTNPSPDATFAMGSSLGGQASLHILLRYPDLFGGAACLSPAFGPQILNKVASGANGVLKGKKIYLDIGGDVDDVRVSPIDLMDHFTDVHQWNPGYFWLDTQLQGQVLDMREALESSGANTCFRKYPGGRHNERAWAQRIDKPLLHLFS